MMERPNGLRVSRRVEGITLTEGKAFLCFLLPKWLRSSRSATHACWAATADHAFEVELKEVTGVLFLFERLEPPFDLVERYSS
jgi:hypothetical protein